MLAHPETLTRSVQTSVEHQIELTAESLWKDVAARLREALNDTTFQTWFGEVERGLGSTATPSCSPSRTTSRASGSRGTSST